MKEIIDEIVKSLEEAQPDLGDYPSISRPLNMATLALEVIRDENSSTPLDPKNTRLKICKNEVKGVCNSIKTFKSPRDEADRARKEQTLTSTARQMILSIIRLAGEGVQNELVHEQVKELHELINTPAGSRNQFNQFGSGAQNNNTGSGSQFNSDRNSGTQHFGANQISGQTSGS